MRANPSGVSGGARLLEREEELAFLETLIEKAAAGQAQLALVEGAAGIGKTRLVAETRRRAAEAGLRVLAARGGELEREFAFGVVRQLFEPTLFDEGRRDRLLAGAGAGARPVFEAPSAEPDQAGGDAAFATLHGLYWLTVNLSADGPLVLAIDDLHWCDHPSLRYLAYLVRRLEGLPVLVVASLRPSEPGVDTALVAEIAGDPLTVSVHPGRLSEPAVAELVRDRLGEGADDVFCATCHTATGGNPLLLNELLKALEAESVEPRAENVELVAELGPKAASRAVLLRLGRLAGDTVGVARALAVLGDGAELASIAALGGVGEEAAAAAVSALVRAEVVRSEPPLGFVHPLVGEAVYRDVVPGERELQHERAARLLADAGAAAERVAAHLLVVPPGGRQWAVETLRSAGGSALQKGAAESAVSYLTRALAEPPKAETEPQVLLELGRAEALTNAPAAAEHLQRAFDNLADPVSRGVIAHALGRVLLFSGHPVEGAAVSRQAAAELPPDLEDLKKGLEAFQYCAVLFGTHQLEALAGLAEYRTIPEDGGAGAKMAGAMAALAWAYSGGSAEECAALALEALAGGQLIEADNGLMSIAATMVLIFADRDEALDAWDAMLDDAHRRGSLFSISSISLWRGFTMLRRGELGEAEDSLNAARREFDLYGYGQEAQVYLSAFLSLTLLERGDVTGARAALERSGAPAFSGDGARYWRNSEIAILVAEGRSQDALGAATEIEGSYGRFENPAAAPWRSLRAEALDQLGRREEALAAAHEELELAHVWGAPATVGRSLRVLGTLEREEGIARLEEAAALVDRPATRLEAAKTLAALGRALRHARRPSDARDPLRRALELAEICGAAALAESVRAELHATGARPRTSALSGVEALTASERRVAALAAEGQSNRDIAQTLFVTPKTVEVHLSSAYRKLGIRSRRELPGALAA